MRGITRAAELFHHKSADSAIGLPASVKGPCRAHFARPAAQLLAGFSLRETAR
jgi:hypothetical protein